ncbi:hypothetical protein L579_3993 [Pantoea sp. AS-PWVM4]|nr:hypothetical protein L579_3993 [Pantoea sp. AS-PWVM4]
MRGCLTPVPPNTQFRSGAIYRAINAQNKKSRDKSRRYGKTKGTISRPF